ncbi:hypothetical protein AB3N04_05005 [Alkalihalophilus sp. As8PL]|uniref:Glycosyl transferase family 2 n=1 Tax=Alkalihalophilus sp. As8PL TaxID=3237103 RepID=A0AB39BVU8_9BACI
MKKLLILIGVIILLSLLPMIAWFLDEPEPIEVAIIDKTVPDETFREHLGITWLLNHYQKTSVPMDLTSDYYGFVPNENEESHTIQALPSSYEGVDLIYLADTYGVYEEDLPWVQDDEKRKGERSSFVYGGLEMEEWSTILNHVNNEPSTLIVEFNSFASPTNPEVRESMTNHLNIEWTGWTGRFFDELDSSINDEIPQWMLDQYEEKWQYAGPGFVLVNDQTEELLVLVTGEHVSGDGVRLQFTEKGENAFGLTDSSEYMYWFDIVIEKDPEEVLAYYNWNLTSEGEVLLEEHGIPVQFAAMTQHEKNASRNYYFAGDFTDVRSVPSFYRYKGVSQIYKWFNQKDQSEQAFFWGTYVPVMKSILNEDQLEALPPTEKKPIATASENDLLYTSRINKDAFEVYVDGAWEELVIKGVNIGMGKPGVFPGEAAITYEEYARWLQLIGEMGANSIRVYTLHPPSFYQALKDYNEEAETPIYLFHGVWIEEESLEETLDAFDESHTEDFQSEMKTIVDVIHGNREVEAEPGHAHGKYEADVSPYVIGWILGIEWYPLMVENTNQLHSDIGDYQGEYVTTSGAEPFEYWLAEQMDTILDYEKKEYEWMRPISFTNWVTTDLLKHPAEPNPEEDLVGVNPNVIHLKNELEATNQFASYHVYPYYPDFLNFEESYLEFEDHRGQPNNYAAYLQELHQAHDIPVLIAEFGVPGSRGLTHENPFGWNQGFLSEQEQGEIIKHLYEDIIHEGMLGGLVFTWQDEWFKRTWNTMDYDNPDHRPFWSNAQTNEQQFGLLSFDRHKIKVDGDVSDWEENEPIYAAANQPLKSLHADHDERYLYLKLEVDHTSEALFEDIHPMILLDTIPEQGNHHLEGIKDLKAENGIDFMIDLKGLDEASLKVDSYYDFFKLQYTYQFKMLNQDEPLPIKNSGKFEPIHLALNQELFIPSQEKVIPFSYYETGKLRHGNGNPNASEYDSLADFYVNEEEGVIEIRIPWLLLNVKDPSSKEVMADLYFNPEGSITIEGIHIGALLLEKGQDSYKVHDSFPKLSEGTLSASDMNMYEWEDWVTPQYEERLKQSYYKVQEAFLSGD